MKTEYICHFQSVARNEANGFPCQSSHYCQWDRERVGRTMSMLQPNKVEGEPPSAARCNWQCSIRHIRLLINFNSSLAAFFRCCSTSNECSLTGALAFQLNLDAVSLYVLIASFLLSQPVIIFSGCYLPRRLHTYQTTTK